MTDFDTGSGTGDAPVRDLPLQDVTFQDLSVTVGDLTFDAVAAGPEQGTGVLFLHGFPETMQMWRPVMASLAAAGHRCVAFNQRGYSPGARPVGVEHYDTASLAGDVLGVLDALGWHRAHLVGHDWGAAVAWRVAAIAPERLRTLNVLSVGHPDALVEAIAADPDQRRRSQYMKFFRRPDSHEVLLADGAARLREWFTDWPDQGEVEHNIAVLSQPRALESALNWYRAAGRQVLADTAISTPTLFIWSNADQALGRVAAQRTAAFVTGPYRFVELDAVGHWIVQQASDRVIGELRDHIGAFAT